MATIQPVSVRYLRIACATALLMLPSIKFFGQAAPEQQKATPATPQASASAGSQPPCALLADAPIPINTTIEAKVTGLLEANHLKPGKKVWVNSIYETAFPGCTIDADAAIYGTVTAAMSSKNPVASEISLQFDSIDCDGHAKKSMKLFLIGVIAPSEDSNRSHDAVPTEVHGGSRQISDAAASTDGYDAKLSAGGPLHTVHPGVVVGFKNLQLEPQGGPECSAKMSSTNRNIELSPGTVLVLAPRSTE